MYPDTRYYQSLFQARCRSNIVVLYATCKDLNDLTRHWHFRLIFLCCCCCVCLVCWPRTRHHWLPYSNTVFRLLGIFWQPRQCCSNCCHRCRFCSVCCWVLRLLWGLQRESLYAGCRKYMNYWHFINFDSLSVQQLLLLQTATKF